ncbi:MAG: T9SS type A sorting domain-containing protein [Saprospiraceae bacterium]
MVKQDLLSQVKGIPYASLVWLSLFLLVFSGSSFGQSQINCNGTIQLSLNSECEGEVRPDMVLEGLMITYNPPFTLRISGSGIIDNNTNSPVITKPGNYVVTVYNSTGNSCWGNIVAEDKLPPIVVDCACPVGNTDPDCTLKCTDEAGFLAGTIEYPIPVVEEYCTDYTTTFSDEVITTGVCGSKTIRRTWVFTDGYGNKSVPCVSEYYFEPVDISVGAGEILPPYNNIQMTCGSDVSMQGVFAYFKAKLFVTYQANYRAQVPGVYPTVTAADNAAERDATAEALKHAWPTVEGVAISNQVCNVMAAKADTELLACGAACSNSKKIIRLWTILDWCSGDTRTITQIIKATDIEAPTVQAPDLTVSVDPWTCSGNFLLPAPTILHDNCDANVNYKVVGPLGVSIVWDVISNRYLVTGAPKGVHTFRYVATDCCDNEGYDEVSVTILDQTAPVAVAKQHIVISLTTGGEGDGIAKLFAQSVDNGSYDSCTPVHIELRREEIPNRDEDGCGYTGNLTYNDDGHPNDGSSDPADPDYDPDHGAYVKFCCADISNREGAVPYGIVKVWMRVWDDGNMSGVYGDVVDGLSDNYNETWVEVRVEDKLTPIILCPANVTVNCDDDIHDLAITGQATAYSNCLNLATEYTDTEFLTGCNTGYVLRTWKIKNRPSIQCIQRIDLVNPFPNFEGTIEWPLDIVTDCSNDAANDKPTWTAGPCDQIGVSLKSDTFYFEGNACMKILNRWTVINWCTYDPNSDDPEGYFTHTSIVKIIDSEKPSLGNCTDKMFEVDDNGDVDKDGNQCERRGLTLTNTATDQGQCASDWLKWTVFVDLWGDGLNEYEFSSFVPNLPPYNTTGFTKVVGSQTINVRYLAPTGQGGEVHVVIPEDIAGSMSNHKVLWKVTDGCGNVTTCNHNFMVVDKKKPTPYCVNVSSALMNNGQVELWAADFNLGSFDNCTSKANLLYTFNEASPVITKLNQTHYFKGAGVSATEAEYLAGNAQKWLPSSRSAGMIFNCDDLPSVAVKMTVWDEKFNYDFCTVTLYLNDNQGACGGTTEDKTSISGTITTPKGETLEGAKLALENNKPEMLQEVLTHNNGEFTFNNAAMYHDYTISGAKNDDYLNGVSTLDLVLIQRHILLVTPLSNAYDVIAADANNDNKVTTADLSEIRKLILGINSVYPNNGSWKFLDKNRTFSDPANPWPLTEKLFITNLNHQMTNQNFVAVKIGDVNGSATSNAIDGTESRSTLQLTADDVICLPNTTTNVALSLNSNQVHGLQFNLNVGDAQLENVMIGSEKLTASNIAHQVDGSYLVSWNGNAPLDGNQLVTIQLVTKKEVKASDVVKISSNGLNAEVYTGENVETSKLSLRFANDTEGSFEVFQNEPNPFSDKTTISFFLPKAGEATLKVTDVNGRTLYTTTSEFGSGVNQFTIQKSDVNSNGVMIYQIESGDNVATKKMIGLE